MAITTVPACRGEVKRRWTGTKELRCWTFNVRRSMFFILVGGDAEVPVYFFASFLA
jgi:hypothetical protein